MGFVCQQLATTIAFDCLKGNGIGLILERKTGTPFFYNLASKR